MSVFNYSSVDQRSLDANGRLLVSVCTHSKTLIGGRAPHISLEEEMSVAGFAFSIPITAVYLG